MRLREEFKATHIDTLSINNYNDRMVCEMTREIQYINSRCSSCRAWNESGQCCGDPDIFWARCARDADYEDIENGSEYYDFNDDTEENTYYKDLYETCSGKKKKNINRFGR